jgi:bacteriorhodopsin
MKSQQVVRNYYVLPCCLLLLNLCVEIVSYKAKVIDDDLLRTAAIMGMVLFGGALVGFVAAPAISAVVATLHRNSRMRFGPLGEALFLVVLGVIVFWLYYRVYIIGPESILPYEWHNPHHVKGLKG